MPSPRTGSSRSTSLAAAAILSLVNLLSSHAAEFHVATNGNDRSAGTSSAPFATIERAQQAVRQRTAGEAATVWLHGGVYRFERSLQFTAADSGTPSAPVVFAAVAGETVELSGARELALTWTQGAAGRWQAKIPAGLEFDQLFADGAKQIRAAIRTSIPAKDFSAATHATPPNPRDSHATPIPSGCLYTGTTAWVGAVCIFKF